MLLNWCGADHVPGDIPSEIGVQALEELDWYLSAGEVDGKGVGPPPGQEVVPSLCGSPGRDFWSADWGGLGSLGLAMDQHVAIEQCCYHCRVGSLSYIIGAVRIGAFHCHVRVGSK